MSTIYTDRYGLPVSTASAAAAAHYVEAIDRLLALNLDAMASLQAALAADPGFAMAHIALARTRQVAGETAPAQDGKTQALALVDGVTRRERQHITALATAIDGNNPTALALIREHLQDFPRDAFALAQAHGPFGLIGFGGAPDRLQDNFDLLDGLATAYGDDWWFLSAYGFAHNELGHWDTARHLAERSLALNPHSGHTAHTVAHVFFETGDDSGGADFLRPWLREYPRQAQIYSHLTWHLALCELAADHVEEVLALYRDILHPDVCPGNPLITLCDAAALLWRCDLYGIPRPAGSPHTVAAFAATAFPRAGVAFADVHGALAYAAAGDMEALGRLSEQLQGRLAQGKLPAGAVVPALVQALTAFVRGDYAGVMATLEPMMAQVVRVGGSNAQRQVFEDTLLVAYLRAGESDRAATLLRQRLARRPSRRDATWLQQAGARDVDW